jgi:addiction module HigA family antidote
MIRTAQDLQNALARWQGIGGSISDFEYVASILNAATCIGDVVAGMTQPVRPAGLSLTCLHYSQTGVWEIHAGASKMLRYEFREKPPGAAQVTIIRIHEGGSRMPDLKHERVGPAKALLKAGITPMAPGTFLAERVIQAKGGVHAAAEAMGMPVRMLKDLIAHRQKVNEEIATRLSHSTDFSAGFWMNLQAASDHLE